MVCKQCNVEFEGRAGAKYCSAKCRKAASRVKCDINVTDEPILVTDNVIPKVKDFHSLPQDVQQSIMRIADSDEDVRQRTIVALSYQQLYPDSRHKGIPASLDISNLLPAGQHVKVSKPGDPDYQPSDIDEHCGCGSVLPQLEQPRQYSGKCSACVCAA